VSSARVFLTIDDPSRVAESRRTATLIAQRQGLSEEVATKASIVASELASNLLKHARQGNLQISDLTAQGEAGVEILSLDRGPGISKASESFRDGHSTAGTLGTGLGAVLRLSDEFDFDSQTGKGTVLVSRIRGAVPAKTCPGFVVGAISRPVQGETACGDAWAIRREGNAVLMMVADGLGHGVLAEDASRAAVDAFHRASEQDPAALVETMHRALKGTRGAAVAVAKIEFDAKRVRFAGLGNIAGVLVTPAKTHPMVSHNGTAGHEARRIGEFEYPWTEESLVVMHSDGLSSNWQASAFPGFFRHHPAVISALLYREAGRERDDACVVAGRRQ
jgi:anti-sigma regulatory factor (Ser/Thr protein kinase)